MGPSDPDGRKVGLKIDGYLEVVSADPPSLEGNVRTLDYYREDLINLAERTTEEWPDGDWLTRPAAPTKSECIKMLGRGSVHAGNIARLVKAIRDHVHATEAN